MLEGSGDEADEDGVRVFGGAFEFGMELDAYEEGVVGEFDDFDKAAGGVDATE